MIHALHHRMAPAALLALAATLAGCDGGDVEINGQKGVPLSEIEIAGRVHSRSTAGTSGNGNKIRVDDACTAFHDYQLLWTPRELGIAAEVVGGAIERVFADQGDRPTAYIAGEEGSGAVVVGARYGRGALHMKDLSASQEVFWQGISIGWDVGGNASRVFTLVYGLFHPDMLYRRYPGVEGSAYLVGGVGVNYQRADGITLAPIRAGVGLRLGASVGYLAYSRQRTIIPF